MPEKKCIPKIYTFDVVERRLVTVYARTRDEAEKHLRKSSSGVIVDITVVSEKPDDGRCDD